MERILRGLRAMTSVDITPGDTLVILDEVQDIPEVLEALKYFKEELRTTILRWRVRFWEFLCMRMYHIR